MSGRKRAIALQYGDSDLSPRVVATGAGEIARRILEIAESNQVPIRRDDSLTEVLCRLDVGFEIPPETFRAVAEILAFLYRTDEHWRRKQLEKGA